MISCLRAAEKKRMWLYIPCDNASSHKATVLWCSPQQLKNSFTNVNTQLSSDSPESLLLIANLISHLSFICVSEENLLHAAAHIKTTSMQLVVLFPSPWALKGSSPTYPTLIKSEISPPAPSSRCVALYLRPSSIISLVCMRGCLSSSRYSCPSPLDEIYCVLLPSFPPDTERKA